MDYGRRGSWAMAEVGQSGTSSVLVAWLRWHQYILLLKVSPRAESMGYRLYDVAVNPMMGPLGPLPNPVAEGAFRHNRNNAPVNIVFDTRRVLSIPPHRPLPAHTNNQIIVNLRAIMNAVMRSIRRQ